MLKKTIDIVDQNSIGCRTHLKVMKKLQNSFLGPGTNNIIAFVNLASMYLRQWHWVKGINGMMIPFGSSAGIPQLSFWVPHWFAWSLWAQLHTDRCGVGPLTGPPPAAWWSPASPPAVHDTPDIKDTDHDEGEDANFIYICESLLAVKHILEKSPCTQAVLFKVETNY